MTDDHPANPSQEGPIEEHRNREPAPKPWHRRFGLGVAGFEATRRAFFLAFLTLLLLIPLGMIEDLNQERAGRAEEVDSEITAQWGGTQTILGPILAVPYRYVTEPGDTTTAPRTATNRLFFLPKRLAIDTEIKTEKRSKSIYDVLVYGGTAKLTGSFVGLANPRGDIAPEMIDWSGAKLLLGIGDVTSVRSLKIAVGNLPEAAEDAVQQDQSLSSSLALAIPLAAADIAKPLDFAVTIDFRGSTALNFAPVADTTTIALKADWPHPDFFGRSLPDEREITDQGFTAKWSMSALSRGFPSSWRTGEVNPETLWNSTVGVGFVEPGDVHQQTDRILKYGVLVIALTFGTIFVNGLFGGRKVHPVQYLMVGAALCLFYLLLLSLAEHIPFLEAYVIASAASIALIAWYAWRTMSRRLGYLTAALLAVVQAYVYDLLQMDDYALLAGTIALFLALLAAMFATRNIDWYRVGQGRGAA
ncbi:MAG TPA: cell envelope integrity protein CreD [Candidatus Cybelea sp.]|nr:cell envelope integrity protein CreD [Candidatus Cybelea sp.]